MARRDDQDGDEDRNVNGGSDSRDPSRRRVVAEHAGGLALTLGLALVALGAGAAAVVALLFFGLAMPITSAVLIGLLALGAIAAWRARRRRRD